MKLTSPMIITISRQLGSGGRYIGQRLAKELNMGYADHEIISQAAKKLSVLEDDLQYRDEKVSSFWNAFSYSSPDVLIPPQISMPTDRELFDAEAEVIRLIAKENSAVIVGRCGSHILRDHPNHVSIFLHGNSTFRKDNVIRTLGITGAAAEKMIVQSDKERAQYNHIFTQREWSDARLYDISIDTGKTGLDKGVELIFNYLKLVQKIEEN